MKAKLFSLITMLLLCTAVKAQQDSTIVLFETNKGNIRCLLYDDTPLHKAAMLKHISEGFYDGVLFHRVIANFMIQAGDPTSKNAEPGWLLGDGDDDTMEKIPAEFVFPKHHHKRGALAAARDGDDVNPEKKSSNCQFYFVWGKRSSDAEMMDIYFKNEKVYENMPSEQWDRLNMYYQRYPGTPWLDGQYTVFGEIIEGLEVVEAIQAMPTDKNDRPQEDVKIIKATVVKGV